MKFILSFSFTLLLKAAFGQDSLLVFPHDLANTKTGKHIVIKNTRLLIIPPPGFTVNDTTPQLRGDKKTNLYINDLDGYDYYAVQGDFTKTHYEKQYKAKLLNFREFKINNYPAKAVFWQYDTAFKIIDLIFGDSTFLARANATLPINDDAIEKDLIQSLQTITYDKSIKPPPFTTTRFRLNDKLSLFKLAKYNSLVHVYSLGGVRQKSYDGQSHLTVLFHPADEGNESDLRHAISEAWESFFTKVKPVRESLKERKDSVNHFLSHETEVSGKLDGRDVIVFIHAILVDRQIAVMQGICYKKEHLGELKKLTHSIKRN